MGAIKQLKNGKFQITVYDHTGKRHRIRFERHKFAKAYVDRIEKEKSDQKLIASGLMKKRSSVENSPTARETIRPFTTGRIHSSKLVQLRERRSSSLNTSKRSTSAGLPSARCFRKEHSV